MSNDNKLEQSLETFGKHRIIAVLLLILFVLIYLSGVAENYISRQAPINTENYGMPVIDCDSINQIRVDSGLPPLDCNTYEKPLYMSDI